MIQRLIRLLRDRTGTAVIEFALVLPVAITMFCGTFEVSNAIIAYMKLAAAAGTVGDLVAQQSAVHSTDIDDFYTAATLVMKPSSSAGLGLAVASVTFNPNTGVASVAWQQTRGTGVAMADAAVAAAGLGSPGDSVIVAQTTYTYNSALKYVLPKALVFSQRVFTRPRLVQTIPFS
jgi:Flp pilus assembly protein TadG